VSYNLSNLLYLITIVTFVLALRYLSNPAHARRGNQIGAAGMVLAIFLGFEVISKVPTLLHTPLMSGTNAIHGVVIVGAMLVLGSGHKGPFTWIVGFIAVVLAAANVVGGFVVTDRMLEMFKKREK
jgi:H+-translocating NAD(P) transhydrogenase subunit alpha